MEKINKPKWMQDGNRRRDTAERLNASVAPPPVASPGTTLGRRITTNPLVRVK